MPPAVAVGKLVSQEVLAVALVAVLEAVLVENTPIQTQKHVLG